MREDEGDGAWSAVMFCAGKTPFFPDEDEGDGAVMFCAV